MVNQRTLVLSSLGSGKEKAVVNFNWDNEKITGKLRLYNFKDLTGILTLGILADGKVVKSGLKYCGKDLYSFEADFCQDLSKFSCALINITNGVAKPLLLGASNGTKPKTMDYKLAENLYLLDEENLSYNKAMQVLNDEEIDYDREEKEVIENSISAGLGGSEKCANCKYREAFFSGCRAQSVENKKIKSAEKREVFEEMDFYKEIKEQLDILFDRYPEETFLNEVIPNSKWIKVDYDDSGEYYVIGLIYENDCIKYISYGVPGQYSVEPPRELSGVAQWLPLDPNKPDDLGYWLSYQDAKNGEAVEVSVS